MHPDRAPTNPTKINYTAEAPKQLLKIKLAGIFSVEMTPSISTAGQKAAAATSGDNRSGDPSQKAHGAAPVSLSQ